MRHSIFSVILMGILFGAMFFFMPHLVIGIFILLVIIRLLHVAFMGHGYYGRRYGRGYDCGYGYGRGYESGCDCGCGHEYDRGHDFRHEHHHDHHYGHGPMHGHLFYWVDKVRNMSDEEFREFKSNMDKGFGYGFRGRHADSSEKSDFTDKSKADSNSESTEKKEETTK